MPPELAPETTTALLPVVAITPRTPLIVALEPEAMSAEADESLMTKSEAETAEAAPAATIALPVVFEIVELVSTTADAAPDARTAVPALPTIEEVATDACAADPETFTAEPTMFVNVEFVTEARPPFAERMSPLLPRF